MTRRCRYVTGLIGRWVPVGLLFTVLAGVCVATRAGAQSLQPAGWDGGIRLTEAVDHNPDPTVVELQFEARVATVELASGVSVEAWTYNGMLPGPLVRVNVGDRLIVHFTNNLPEPSTIHWHGLRIPIDMDGVPGYSQPPVEPGGTFTYDFIVPDAGIYWSHPHVMSAAQVGFGLYGALLVDDPSEEVGVADDLVIVLSDIDLTDDMTLASPDTGGSVGMLFGREGNHVLVNGRRMPTLVARSGAPQRWPPRAAISCSTWAKTTSSGRLAAMGDWWSIPKTTRSWSLAPVSAPT